MKKCEVGTLTTKRYLENDGRTIRISTKKSTLTNLLINAIEIIYLTKPTKKSKGRVHLSTTGVQKNQRIL